MFPDAARESLTALGNVMAQFRHDSDWEEAGASEARQAEVSIGDLGEDGGVSVGLASWCGEDTGVCRTMLGVFVPCEDCGGVGVEVCPRVKRWCG